MSDSEMAVPVVSVIIASRDRPTRLAATLDLLTAQTMPAGSFEIIVVDDGSSPPVSIAKARSGAPAARLLRTESSGRSAARNQGARDSRGHLLAFLDDDVEVGPEFVARHRAAHEAWGDVLVTGAIRLPDEDRATPFGRFRHALEQSTQPGASGPGAPANFAAAGNLSIARDAFLELGGFDPQLSSAEDQDLALRFSARGGRIAYLAEAVGIHRDGATDIRSYCARVEWGMEQLVPFLRKHPSVPDNVERLRVNGPLRWPGDAPWGALKKLLKSALGKPPLAATLFSCAAALERLAPGSVLLDRLYRLLLGIHLMRGLRRGLLSRAEGSA